MAERNGRRVAVVAGCRTPFCKSGTTLKDARAVDLARYVARELLERTNLDGADVDEVRSEEHTSELQSQSNLVCRLLLEKKKKNPSLGRESQHLRAADQ